MRRAPTPARRGHSQHDGFGAILQHARRRQAAAVNRGDGERMIRHLLQCVELERLRRPRCSREQQLRIHSILGGPCLMSPFVIQPDEVEDDGQIEQRELGRAGGPGGLAGAAEQRRGHLRQARLGGGGRQDRRRQHQVGVAGHRRRRIDERQLDAAGVDGCAWHGPAAAAATIPTTQTLAARNRRPTTVMFGYSPFLRQFEQVRQHRLSGRVDQDWSQPGVNARDDLLRRRRSILRQDVENLRVTLSAVPNVRGDHGLGIVDHRSMPRQQPAHAQRANAIERF